MKAADWETWRIMPQVELWQAVALSMNIEPDSLPRPALRTYGRDWFEDCPEEFKRRRQIAIAHAIAKTLPYVEWKANDNYIVLRTADFARWAVLLPLARPDSKLPLELIALAKEPEVVEAVVVKNGGWPWGAHETELLRQLAAAAQRFWVRVDPEDNTTAPTNKEVSAWLQERKVSERVADAMATILRADDLPPGPRT